MSIENQSQLNNKDLLLMATEIVSSYVGQNTLPANQLAEVIDHVFLALGKHVQGNFKHVREIPKPAIPIRKSITDDYIICLEDGKKLKMLKRHLRSTYNMSPEEYRTKWGLSPDYPMVAPNYAAKRSDFAKKIGLGRGSNSRGRRRKSASDSK